MKDMLYYHHDTITPQILEGIDKIQLKINENIYPSINRKNLNKYRNELNIVTSQASKFGPGVKYLNIHGEFIDKTQSLLVTITQAVLSCIQDDVFVLPGALDNYPDFEYTLRFIRENLPFFIDNESGIEFSFDFMPQSINVMGDIIVCPQKNEYSEAYSNYMKLSINDRLKNRKLIRYENTLYSLDRKGTRRDSTISLYNRNLRLIDKNNEYPVHDIAANIYHQRIEFRITSKAFREYLSQENMKGSYKDVMEWFSPLLARNYYKYFYGLVDVIDDGRHPMFQSIYKQVQDLAASNAPYNTKMPKNFPDLVKVKSTPNGNLVKRLKRIKYPNDVNKAIEKEVERQNNDDIQFNEIDDVPDMIFPLAFLSGNTHYHGPTDYKDKNRIDADLADDEFVFFKNDWRGPIGPILPKSLNSDNDKPPHNKK